ncbi:GNAT family N-acetyltransferase [Halobacillus sp. A1]|uniref:GNAT family N-acetyltransferase n=1 Tax=Halobacillus sp. A1 TaxID=2880262 RepID=UPI0020A6C324|nr:GNAT family protein [Halobacillus sp. A1]MCP3032279.1 GNAT family N-acetyltransferase [Halobacillus sp. A1]
MKKGKSIYIRMFQPADARALLALQEENRTFFERASMPRKDEFYTMDRQLEKVQEYEERSREDQEYNFGIFTKESNRLVGTINLFQVMRGALQSAFVGYFLDEKHNGRGFTTEAVKLIVDYAFAELQLHRIEAGVMPHNSGSMRVLEKAGFHKEGLARKNVKINGRWEDHQVLAIINPED